MAAIIQSGRHVRNLESPGQIGRVVRYALLTFNTRNVVIKRQGLYHRSIVLMLILHFKSADKRHNTEQCLYAN